MEIIVFIMQTILQKQNIAFDQLKADVLKFPSIFALGYQRPTITYISIDTHRVN